MTDSEKPQRRERYIGKHPRSFDEKYKEHDPERYVDDVAKVVASGKTPAGTHRPIMVAEILEALEPWPGDVVIDATLGYGGHARELLKAVQPGGRLLGIDTDPLELPKTEARLRALGFPPEAVAVRRMNYAGLANWVGAEVPAGADMLLADLGLSSMQIDNPARGFSYRKDGPLDMRMNPEHGQSASALLSKLNEDELAAMLREYSDEPHALKLAAAILKAHRKGSLTSTLALAEVVSSATEKFVRTFQDTVDGSVQRVFQALRIAVNDEFMALDEFLRTMPYCLKPGGRVAILSFHSGEDRRVKLALKNGLQAGLFSSIAPEVVRATMEEQRSNPRSSAAKLRFAVRAPM